MSIDLEAQLFVDAGVAGRGHRLNLMNGAFREVGDGLQNGPFMGFNATLVTQNFGSTGTGQFLTGVSYLDSDQNGFYSLGEGRNGVGVGVNGGQVSASGYVATMDPASWRLTATARPTSYGPTRRTICTN